ncbi:MAG: 50S ribosomal protein L22 [Candidatus Liptonbacteria bacterium]|nr:50S ribosomal protein L22 [Candidatus Liptonbacteria bacterium]
MKEQIVHLRFLHNAPRKVRLVANVIKGMPANRAEAHLRLMKRRAAQPIAKLLHAAVSAASQNNMKSDALYVKSVFVNKGPHMKRFLPRARGMATPIHKTMSHVTLILAEGAVRNDEFALVRRRKKTTTPVLPKKQPQKKAADENGRGEWKQARSAGWRTGMIRRIFRRKSV